MNIMSISILILASLTIGTHAILSRDDVNYFGLEADRYNWSNHPCHRECGNDERPMTCYYVFVVEVYMTMTKACYGCPRNATDCLRPHCLTADGLQKLVYVVNRKLPGPNIEVCKGDKIVVDVRNALGAEGTTVHWHGIRQKGSPYMDGVPYVTQCPILPGETFRYQFNASQTGTYFWHSHIGGQRADGMFGGLVIRGPPKSDPHANHYDFDQSVMLLIDWKMQSEIEFYAWANHVSPRARQHTILVNGLGPYKNFARYPWEPAVYTPRAVFHVKKGYRYRFRLVNAGADNCPIQMSIDNHPLQVISMDGRDVISTEVDSIYSWPGERYDFVVNANQPIDNYWIRYRGFGHLCNNASNPDSKVFQTAILRYDSAKLVDPISPIGWDILPHKKRFRELNPYNTGEESRKAISLTSLVAIAPNDESLSRNPDHRFYIGLDLNPIDNFEYHRSKIYGFKQVEKFDINATMGSYQFDHISFRLPPVPVLSQRDMLTQDMFCNTTTLADRDCSVEHCACTNLLKVKYNSVVELIIVDEGNHDVANHPMHLHGHFFRIIATEKLKGRVTVDRVKKLDRKGKIRRTLDHPPLKDTAKIPSGGYIVIRFYANNPGFWFFHCHFEQHTELGLAFIVQVAEHKDMDPVPANFPKCGSYVPQIM